MDRSWRKEWNQCARANLHLKNKNKKRRQGLSGRTVSPNPRKRRKSRRGVSGLVCFQRSGQCLREREKESSLHGLLVCGLATLATRHTSLEHVVAVGTPRVVGRTMSQRPWRTDTPPYRPPPPLTVGCHWGWQSGWVYVISQTRTISDISLVSAVAA